jgi:hypothetical protein
MNALDEEQPSTPTKMTDNGGGCRVQPNGQMDSDDDSYDELTAAKP